MAQQLNDLDLAWYLFHGLPRVPSEPGHLAKTKFPSGTTKPTERECRAALARVLRNNPPRPLLDALAASLDPGKLRSNTKLVYRHIIGFQNYNSGEYDPFNEGVIADMVQRIKLVKGLSQNKAVKEVAEWFDLTERWVKELCSRHRNRKWFAGE